jgi:hypothetical protein
LPPKPIELEPTHAYLHLASSLALM